MPLLLLTLSHALVVGAGPSSPDTIAVLPIEYLGEAKGGVEEAVVEEAVLAALQRTVKGNVIGRSDIKAVLDFDDRSDLRACDAEECFKEIGGALGVARLVKVVVARSERLWTVAAKIIALSAGELRVGGRLVEATPGDADDLIAALPGIMRRLMRSTQGARKPLRLVRRGVPTVFRGHGVSRRGIPILSEQRENAITAAVADILAQAVGALGAGAETGVLLGQLPKAGTRYVVRQHVLEERKRPGGLSVSVEAELDVSRLRDDLEKILAARWQADRQKAILAVGFEATPERSYRLDDRFVAGAVIQNLKRHGYTIVDAGPLTPEDTNALRAAARNVGAEVVFVVIAQANDTGSIMGTQMHAIRGIVSLRLVEVATGQILADVTVQKAVGHIDVPAGAQKAVAKASADAVVRVIQTIDADLP